MPSLRGIHAVPDYHADIPLPEQLTHGLAKRDNKAIAVSNTV